MRDLLMMLDKTSGDHQSQWDSFNGFIVVIFQSVVSGPKCWTAQQTLPYRATQLAWLKIKIYKHQQGNTCFEGLCTCCIQSKKDYIVKTFDLNFHYS